MERLYKNYQDKLNEILFYIPLHKSAFCENTWKIVCDIADLNVPINDFEDTLIHIAARNKNFPVCKQLIDHGANPHAHNASGETALSILQKMLTGIEEWDDFVMVSPSEEQETQNKEDMQRMIDYICEPDIEKEYVIEMDSKEIEFLCKLHQWMSDFFEDFRKQADKKEREFDLLSEKQTQITKDVKQECMDLLKSNFELAQELIQNRMILNKCEALNKSLENDLETQREKYNQQISENQELTNKLIRENKALKNVNKEIISDLEEASEENLKYIIQHDEWMEQNRQLIKENQEIYQDKNEISREYLALKEAHEFALSQIEQYKRENEELEIKVLNLSEENDNLSKALNTPDRENDKEIMMEKIYELEGENQILTGQNYDLQDQNKILQEEYEQFRQLASEESAELMEIIVELENSVDISSGSEEEAFGERTPQNEITRLSVENESLEERHNHLLEKFAEHQTAYNRDMRKMETVNNINSIEIETLNETIQNYKVAYEQVKSDYKELIGEYNELQEQCEIAIDKKEITKLNQAINELNQELLLTKTSLNELNELNIRKNTELHFIANKYGKLEQDLERAKRVIKNGKSEMHTLKNIIIQQKQQIVKLMSAN